MTYPNVGQDETMNKESLIAKMGMPMGAAPAGDQPFQAPDYGYSPSPLPSSPQSPNATVGGSPSRWNQNAKSQMDAIGQKYGRQWRDDEYDQWLGPKGYLSKHDVTGTGHEINPYSGEGEIDPYWQMRLMYHATGDYNGDNPAYDAAIGNDKSLALRDQLGMMGGMGGSSVPGQSDLNSLLQGDALGSINAALSKLNQDGSVNIQALIRALQGA